MQPDLQSLGLKKEDTDDRKKWRRMIRVDADPSAGRHSFNYQGDLYLQGIGHILNKHLS